jgi:two-component system sensor histidine kinase VicK
MHQVRTAMSALKWIIKMFLDGDLGALTPEQRNLLQKAFDSNERAVMVANELLHFNKTENAAEKMYKIEKVNMVEIIDNAIFDFFGEARDKKLEVIFIKPEYNFPQIEADKEKIQIIFQNVLENALKYSDIGGKIFITLSHTKENLQVSVKNTGIVISAESRDKIFEKFYRSPEAQKKEIVGSGLGLYTIKKMVESHKGKIWFDSSKEDGTIFYFEIPLMQQNVA